MTEIKETINCSYQTLWCAKTRPACKYQPDRWCWKVEPGCELEEKYKVNEEAK